MLLWEAPGRGKVHIAGVASRGSRALLGRSVGLARGKVEQKSASSELSSQEHDP